MCKIGFNEGARSTLCVHLLARLIAANAGTSRDVSAFKISVTEHFYIIKMVRLSQLLGGALRRRSSDQRDKPENEHAVSNLAAQTEGLSISDAKKADSTADNENYAVAWNDPSKFACESERVALLQSFAVLKTPAEHRFDCITK